MADAQLPEMILFPHGDVGRSRGERILESCGPFALCLPWYEEAPAWAVEHGVKILLPPEQMKPPSDFPRILAQYRTHMEKDRPADYLAYAAALKKNEEPGFLDLAAMIRQGKALEPARHEAFRLNLLIHLYHETEKAEEGAEEYLERLRTMPSPLKGAIEEEADGILKDLAPSISEVRPIPARARQILDAWLSLFSVHLASHTSLITLKPWVVETVFLMLGEETDTGDGTFGVVRYTLPKKAGKALYDAYGGLPGKEIILLR